MPGGERAQFVALREAVRVPTASITSTGCVDHGHVVQPAHRIVRAKLDHDLARAEPGEPPQDLCPV